MSKFVCDTLVDNEGKEYASSSLDGKIVGLYFSASWCPPCRKFTPILAEAYKKCKDDGKDFEVVLVPRDNGKDKADAYHKKMPWLSIPFGDSSIEKLVKDFKIRGIPSLILVDGNGKVIREDGRAAIMGKGAAGYPWVKSRVNELTQEAVGDLQEKPSICVFMESAPAEFQSEIEAELKKLSEDSKFDSFAFFTITKEGFSARVRQFLGLQTPLFAAVVDLKKDLKYIDPVELALGTPTKYAYQYLAGEATPFKKSAPRPENDADPAHPGVTIATANTFDELVVDEKSGVFLDVYADWCGPCVAIKPVIEKIAKILCHDMKVPNLRIAKLDSDKNDKDSKYIPENHIPVLKWFPIGGGDPVPCDVRSDDDIVKFIHRQVKGTAADFDLQAALSKL